MSNVYRTMQSMHRRPPSRWRAVLGALGAVAVAAGVFVLAVRWFRSGAAQVEVADETADAEVAAVAATVPESSRMTLVAVNGVAAEGAAQRTASPTEFSLTIVATLPTIDTATSAYEAWFVTPGITDFFSLGELYAREDGKWGLVWTQPRALVRSDIGEFTRIIIIREPRDGNPAPSLGHVLDGEF